jgi:hypothetical protein
MSRDWKTEEEHIDLLRSTLTMAHAGEHIDISKLPPAGDGNAWDDEAVALFGIAKHVASRVGYRPFAYWTGDGWHFTWQDADDEGPEESLAPLLPDDWFPTTETVTQTQLEALGFETPWAKAST